MQLPVSLLAILAAVCTGKTPSTPLCLALPVTISASHYLRPKSPEIVTLRHDVLDHINLFMSPSMAGVVRADSKDRVVNSKRARIVKGVGRKIDMLICWTFACCTAKGSHAHDPGVILGDDIVHKLGLLLCRWLPGKEAGRSKVIERILKTILAITHVRVISGTSPHANNTRPVSALSTWPCWLD